MDNTQICGTCKRFHQHYIRHRRGQYGKCGYGHCVTPGLKPRSVMAKACPYYEAGT